jgi:hypothetical protein
MWDVERLSRCIESHRADTGRLRQVAGNDAEHRRALRANHIASRQERTLTYRSDSLVWQQVAELSFDSFMLRMRTRS